MIERKNEHLVSVIKSGLKDFKNETENMSEKEKEIENPNEIVDIIKNFITLIT